MFNLVRNCTKLFTFELKQYEGTLQLYATGIFPWFVLFKVPNITQQRILGVFSSVLQSFFSSTSNTCQILLRKSYTLLTYSIQNWPTTLCNSPSTSTPETLFLHFPSHLPLSFQNMALLPSSSEKQNLSGETYPHLYPLFVPSFLSQWMNSFPYMRLIVPCSSQIAFVSPSSSESSLHQLSSQSPETHDSPQLFFFISFT